MLTRIISLLTLLLVSVQPAAAAKIIESKHNRYAEGAQITAGAKLAVLVTKRKYSVQSYIDGEPVSEIFEVKRWGDNQYIVRGSTVVLKALIHELKALGYQVRLINQPRQIQPDEYLIAPNVALRRAKLKGRSVKWDNTRATIEARGSSSGDYSWRGTHHAVSLYINAYTPEGDWLFRSFGGVALPHYADLQKAKNIIKDEIYDNKKLMDGGIQQALLPFKKLSVEAAQSYRAVTFMEAMKNPLRFKRQQCSYKEYLEQHNHKAFFIFNDMKGKTSWGSYSGADSIKEAMEQARAYCEEDGNRCELLDLDGELMVRVPDFELPENCSYENQ